MAVPVTLSIGEVVLRAELNDSAGAREIARRLPLTCTMSRWGEEYYGDCGVSLPAAADARELMEVGEIAFWPPGNALCIFFGQTPASTDARPRAASPVSPVGRLLEDPAPLRGMGRSVRMRIAAG
jgi:hypothetical protein